ncbi:hypothetical protein [Streptomyces sp. NPDC059176]|uniref:BACON domain-containing protein n=1 Tax=Streptomyces sp. NPDC059176 TaxID=3346758 RepID=UPI00367B68F0
MLEPPADTTGAHRAHRRAPGQTLGQTPPARYEEHLDGLFTYCLSVLCDHASATTVLGEVLAISERQQGRCPADEAEGKAWLYALARWSCLRALSEQRRRRRQGAGTHGADSSARVEETVPQASAEAAERHRAELARLAWPEAAGTTPEQREALELAVRHRLGPRQVAAVLGMEQTAARELLASAACEVERTRAALAVVESGTCPSVARLADDHQVLLSAALRRELVRHVDDCPRCRRAAEHAGAAGPWPGSSVAPAASGAGTAAPLPLVAAPRLEAHRAMLRVPRARAHTPRFGRNGFPMDPKDHAARRGRLRARAITTTVVATVVAAPVLALWAAYRSAPEAGEGRDGASVTASATDGRDGLHGSPHEDYEGYEEYENAGNARKEQELGYAAGGMPRTGAGGVTVEVILPPGPPGTASAPGRGPGRLTVEAQPFGDVTSITLTASGGAPVSWSLWSDAPWLHASTSYGTLSPGESVTIRISVDHGAEPSGRWSARVGVDPAGAVVQITGDGAPSPPQQPEQPPSADPPPAPDPSPSSGQPSGEPSPPPEPPPATDPSPSEPPPATPSADPATND